MAEAFICDAARTPIGRYGGALAAVRADDLAAVPIKALMARHAKVDWEALDDVLLGCANQAGEDNRNVARMAVLLAGLPERVPGATVNRLCGSGLDAIGTAARTIRTGEAAGIGAGLAHQAHGAIGFTYEHSLHFATRRLWSWRAEFGSESRWAQHLGRKVAARGADRLWTELTAR